MRGSAEVAPPWRSEAGGSGDHAFKRPTQHVHHTWRRPSNHLRVITAILRYHLLPPSENRVLLYHDLHMPAT